MLESVKLVSGGKHFSVRLTLLWFWNIKSSQMIMQLQYDDIKTSCSVQSHVAHGILIKYVARSKVKIKLVDAFHPIWSERRYSLPGYNSMCLKGLKNKLAQMTIYDNVWRVKAILVGYNEGYGVDTENLCIGLTMIL